MNCLIVDDEVLAQDLLALYISRIDFLTLTGTCDNALSAFAALNKGHVDVMFLDINMPEMSGLELVKSLKNPPRVILTTAYEEYALEGYELDIADYLLKPIRFERFLKAVNKVQQMQNTNAMTVEPDETFYVRSDRKLVRIDSREVLYIEALKNYLAICTGTQKIIVHSTLASIQEQMNHNPHFIQTHRSFIVNTRFVKELGTNMIRLKNNTELPIGGLYKDNLLQALRIFNT